MPRPTRNRHAPSNSYLCCYEQIAVADDLLYTWWEWREQQCSVRSISSAMACRVTEFGDPALISMPRGTNNCIRYRKAEDINAAMLRLEDQIWIRRRENRGAQKSWQWALCEAWCQLPYEGGHKLWLECLDAVFKAPAHWDSVRLDVYGAVKLRGLV
jgi:hypothetical protein